MEAESAESNEQSVIADDHQRLEETLRRGDSCSTWVTENAGRGIQVWRAAAEKGDHRGQILYGLCLELGSGVQKNESAAFELYKQASASGDVPAAFGLAHCYDKGVGTPKDHSKAAYWLRIAADHGLAVALTQLGYLYHEGRGVEADQLFAYDCWRLAADQGYPEAQRCVGIAYANGYGVEQDQERAREWLLDAKARGDEEALRLLQGIPGNEDQTSTYPERKSDRNEEKNEANSTPFGGPWPSKLLTQQIAEEFLNDEDSQDFYQYKTIEDEAAAVLASYRGDQGINLNGLEELSDSAAASLARCPGRVSVRGLKRITPVVWDTLLGPELFPGLALSNLEEMSDELAATLAGTGEALNLNGLKQISDSAAEILSRHQGTLYLEGLTSITDFAAEKLSRHPGLMRRHCVNERRLILAGLVESKVWQYRKKREPAVQGMPYNQRRVLMRDLATQFSEDPSAVDLAEFTHITLGAAAALGGDELCEIDLDLGGIVELDPETAAILAQNQGEWLNLSGLTSVTADLIEALASYHGAICLNGLETIDEVAAHATYCLFGPLLLDGLKTLDVGLADALSSHSRDGSNYLSLSGLRELTPESAENLRQHGGPLYLDGLESMSTELASALALHSAGLSLENLKNLSDAAARVLRECAGELSIDLDNLPKSAAAILREHPSFNGTRIKPNDEDAEADNGDDADD